MKHLNLFVLTMMLLMCLPSANAQNAQTKKNAQDSVSSKIWDGDYGEIMPQFHGEIMPQFPGGDKALKEFIQKNLRYPTEAMKKGIQGRVIVSFNVETDGSITDAKVVKAVDSLLNNEALRIVKSMPKWKPGEMMSKGKTVLTRCKYTIPVIFKLEEKKHLPLQRDYQLKAK